MSGRASLQAATLVQDLVEGADPTVDTDEPEATEALLAYIADLESDKRKVSRALDIAIRESEDAGNIVPSLVHVVASDLRRTLGGDHE